MRSLLWLSFLASTALAQNPPTVSASSQTANISPIFRSPIQAVKVPYSVSIRTCGQSKPAAGSCHLKYKGIVLASHHLDGKDNFRIDGSFLLNNGVSEVQLRCDLDGFDPLLESLPLSNNSLKAEVCFDTKRLYQEPVVDLDRGIARVRLQIPRFRENKVWLSGRTFVQLTTEHKDIFNNSWNGDPLLPEIPLTSFYLALPLDAKITRMLVKPGRAVGGLNLPLVPKSERGPSQFQGAVPPRFDKEIYYSGPGEITLEKSSRFKQIADREQNIVKVSVPLVDFIAQQSTLRYYDDVEITVSFRAASRCFRAPVSGRDPIDIYHAKQLVGLQRMVLNAQDVQDVCRSNGERHGEIIAPQMFRAEFAAASGPNLIIVAPPAFQEEADRLRRHKELLGIRSQVMIWEGDNAADLKDKLNAEAERLRPNFMQWVLLLGDTNQIPTYYDEALGDPLMGDYAESAGDVYYTQFTDNPESYTSSMEPKLSIGRIPAKTEDELNRVLDRIMRYENSPPTVDYFYLSPTIAATLQLTAQQNSGADGNYAEFMEKTVAQPYLKTGFRPERIFRTNTEQALKPGYWSGSNTIDYDALTRNTPGIPSLLFHMDGSQDQIDGAVKRGTGVLFNRGHATVRNWAWPNFTYDSKRFSLFPADKPPMVFSLSCLTGFFDSETIHKGHITSDRSDFKTTAPNARFMAESMLLDPNGALGVMASSRQSASDYNNSLIDGLARSLIEKQSNNQPLSQHLGDIMVDAKVFAKRNMGSLEDAEFLEDTHRHHFLVYNLFGDPSVELRQATPLRVQGQPSVRYDSEMQTLRIRFRMESIACPGCDLSKQTEQPFAVLMGGPNSNVVQRAFATTIVSENGENREVVLRGVSDWWGYAFDLSLSHAGLIPYHQRIDNRLQ